MQIVEVIMNDPHVLYLLSVLGTMSPELALFSQH